jgi:predicted nuclease of predicted toxin-antitoxin system
MRFLPDENVSRWVCPHVKAAGHDAVHVAKIGHTSAQDQVILSRPATGPTRVLVSSDHDLIQLLLPPETPGPRSS